MYGNRVIKRLAWVTTREARGLDEDEPPALNALREAGVEVEVIDWDDPAADWSGFDRAVVRSPGTTRSACPSSCAGSTGSRRSPSR